MDTGQTTCIIFYLEILLFGNALSGLPGFYSIMKREKHLKTVHVGCHLLTSILDMLQLSGFRTAEMQDAFVGFVDFISFQLKILSIEYRHPCFQVQRALTELRYPRSLSPSPWHSIVLSLFALTLLYPNHPLLLFKSRFVKAVSSIRSQFILILTSSSKAPYIPPGQCQA